MGAERSKSREVPPELVAAIERALLDTRAGSWKRVGPGKQELFFTCFEHAPDADPSARWNREKRAWYCFPCGKGGGAIALAKRLGIELPRKGARRIVAEYSYRDEQGALLYQAVRYEPKKFSFRRPDAKREWVWSLKGVRRVLYRLPELLAADPAVTVYVVRLLGDE